MGHCLYGDRSRRQDKDMVKAKDETSKGRGDRHTGNRKKKNLHPILHDTTEEDEEESQGEHHIT